MMIDSRWQILSVAIIAVAILSVAAILANVPTSTNVTLTSSTSSAPPTQRISASGFDYGGCAGVVLAVDLYPEPCAWTKMAGNRLDVR